MGAEGLRLKRRRLGYLTGPSAGRDYIFTVWSAGELVPEAKASSGLSEDEIAEVDRFVRKNAIERLRLETRVCL
ncbi:MAG: hypothetical protein M2R45_00451 [Verrucomicrobia subdivision 3 bacterium]|nr:hypothetical protein [Limisphaerales bacterium]MCS1413669.1 hypothetical protein [Limisphaerales bacterium]